MPIRGLLNLNKPTGLTSRDAINRVQRLLPRKTRIGHAGTLDPLASGVLVACVGSATRLIDYVQRMPKCYTGTFLLGRQSPTEDVEGDVEVLRDPPVPTCEEIVRATGPLTGRIEQRPPAFSALKVNGRRAYDLARQGQHVELAARPVDIYRLNVIGYDYPALTLEVECGSGTYIRSLGRDLARSLGTEAVMSALTRTAIGGFCLAEAVDPTTLDMDGVETHLLPPLQAVAMLPRITLSDDEAIEIGHGRTIPGRQPDRPAEEPSGAARSGVSSAGSEMAAIDSRGRLAAILAERSDGQLGPVRNFPTEG